MSWIFLSLLSAFFAALVAILGKLGIKEIDSTLATGVRAAVMAVAMLIAVTALGKWKFVSTIDGRALSFIVMSGLAGALSWLFYFLALKSGKAASVAAVDRLSVVFVLILATLFLGELATVKSWLGAALIVIGAILMVLG